jgi:hypothetical protein
MNNVLAFLDPSTSHTLGLDPVKRAQWNMWLAVFGDSGVFGTPALGTAPKPLTAGGASALRPRMQYVQRKDYD